MSAQLKKFPTNKNLKLKNAVNKIGTDSIREIYSFENGRNHELTDNEYYTLAISKLSSRFHIVIH